MASFTQLAIQKIKDVASSLGKTWDQGIQNIKNSDPLSYTPLSMRSEAVPITMAAGEGVRRASNSLFGTNITPEQAGRVSQDVGYGIRGAISVTPFQSYGNLTPRLTQTQSLTNAITPEQRISEKVGRGIALTTMTSPLGGGTLNMVGNAAIGTGLGTAIGAGTDLWQGKPITGQGLMEHAAGGFEYSGIAPLTSTLSELAFAKFAPNLASKLVTQPFEVGAIKEGFKRLFAREMLDVPLQNTAMTIIGRLDEESKNSFMQDWIGNLPQTVLMGAGNALVRGTWNTAMNQESRTAVNNALKETIRKWNTPVTMAELDANGKRITIPMWEYKFRNPKAGLSVQDINKLSVEDYKKVTGKEPPVGAQAGLYDINKYWVKDYSNYDPLRTGHPAWGTDQAGFNLSKNGKVDLTDNRPVKMLPEQRRGVEAKYTKEFDSPTHRNLQGDYSGLYSFKDGKAELYLYPGAEKNLTPEMKKGMASLIGVHDITADTPVISNNSRKVLFKLGDVQGNIAQQPMSVPKGGKVTKGNLSSQPVTDLQRGTKLSPTQLVSEISTRTKANQAVSSPISIAKGQLNVENLNLKGAGKQVVQRVKQPVTTIGNKEVVKLARTAKGTGTLSDETMKKLMAQQLKNRQVVVDLSAKFNQAKKAGASEAELGKIMLDIANQSRTAQQGGTFAGRLLQAQNILADQSASPMQKIFALLDNAGADKVKYVQDAVKVDWENPTQVVDFYRKYVPPKFGEVLDEIRYSNMLSSPITHIVNTASNALQTGIVAPIEKTITGVLDWGKSKLTGSERQYYAKSGIDYASGYVKALPDAFRKFKKVMSGEQVLVKPDYERIPTGTKGILSTYTTPLKMLEAADQFFKTLVESGVTNELKNGPIELSATDIAGKATKEANYRLFRQAFDPNGELGSGIVLKTFDRWNSAIANLRRLPGGKWLLPFLQTPTNVLKQGIEYSPLGISTMIGSKAPIEQLSKTLIGASVFVGAYGLAKSGMTTWDAPSNGAERDLFYSSGMQPYSVKIGNNWVSYSKLGPLSYPIAMGAAIANADKKNPDKKFIDNVGSGALGILGFFGDQSYVRSIGDLVDAIKGGTNISSNAVSSEASNLAGQLIPYHSFLTWLGRMTDPTYRKAGNFSEKMIKDLPIVGSSLKPYEDLQGNPSKRDNPLINAVSPYQITNEKAPEATMLKTLQSQKISNDVQKRADEAFMTGDTSVSATGGIYRYAEDGSLKKIDTGKIMSMPESTNYQKALKENEAYKLVDNIQNSTLSEADKQKALSDIGVSQEDSNYYIVAKMNNDIKQIYLTDEISRITAGSSNRNDLLNFLATQRNEVNGSMILTDTIITQLNKDNVISDNEAKMLKNLTIKKGQVVKKTGRAKKIAIKAISLPKSTKAPTTRIKTMAQLLAKSGKIRAKRQGFITKIKK